MYIEISVYMCTYLNYSSYKLAGLLTENICIILLYKNTNVFNKKLKSHLIDDIYINFFRKNTFNR